MVALRIPRRLVPGAVLVAMVSIGPGPAGSQGADGPGLVERTRWLAAALDRELTAAGAGLGTARVGIAVRDLATGQLVYAHDGDGAYNLASNTKLLTAAASLAALGPGFTWRTSLHGETIDVGGVIPGDLHVRGRGNPTLGTADLDALAAQLAELGVTRVRGAIAIDASYFDAVDSPPHFEEQPKEQAHFRAPIAATSLNYDAIKVVVRPGAVEGPARVAAEPPSDYVVVKAEVATVARGRSRVRIESKVVADQLELTVRGQIRLDERAVYLRRRVPDPAAYLAAVLRERLAAHGVRVDGKRPRRAIVPLSAHLLAEHQSPPLAVVARDLGKHSNNYVAEMMLKTLGAEMIARGARPATWADGLGEVRRYLTEVVGLPAEGFYVGNGSGLFQASRMSPGQLTRVLDAAHRDYRFGPDLVAALSISGVDGTLARRMLAGPAARRVRAKTGSLTGVSTLAGYVALDGAAPLGFAILVNDIPEGGSRTARTLQDRVCETLVHYLEAAAPGAVLPEPGLAPPAAPARGDDEAEPEAP